MNTVKKQISIRLSPAALSLVARAAEESGVSVGEVVESCVVNQAKNVVESHKEEKAFLQSAQAVRNVSAAARKRPRDERSDKGTQRRRESEVLPKDQLS